MIITKTVHSNRVMPPGGWVYTQGKIKLVAETFDLLRANVMAHRSSNGIPPGDVAKEIRAQIKINYPNWDDNSI